MDRATETGESMHRNALNIAASIISGAAAIFGVAYVIGWFHMKAYLAAFDGSFLLPHVPDKVLLLKAGGAGIFLGLAASLALMNWPRWLWGYNSHRYLMGAALCFGVLGVTLLTIEFYSWGFWLQTSLLIIKDLQAFVFLLYATWLVRNIIVWFQAGEPIASWILPTLLAVFFYGVDLAPSLIGSSAARRDQDPKGSTLPIVVAGSTKSLRALLILEDRIYAINLDDQERPREIIPVGLDDLENITEPR